MRDDKFHELVFLEPSFKARIVPIFDLVTGTMRKVLGDFAPASAIL